MIGYIGKSLERKILAGFSLPLTLFLLLAVWLLGSGGITASIFFLFIGVLLLLTAGCWSIARAIGRNARQLSAELDSLVGDIDLSRRVPQSGNDDIARIGRRLNELLGLIQSAVAETDGVIEAMGQADFSKRARSDLKGDLGRLVKNVNHSVESIQHTVGGVQQFMKALGEGDFSFEAANLEMDKHLKQSAIEAMRGLRDMMGEINRVMDSLARGNLSERVVVESRGDIDTLKARVNVSLEQLDATFSEFTGHVQQVAAASGQVSLAIGHVSDGAQNQRHAIGQLATAVVQSSQAVSDVSANADKARQRIHGTGEAVRHGQEKMRQMLAVVEAIAESSEKINKITDVIAGIANKTNLLSLNAAIEAARVGEAGRGFAVVAEEVRKLAETSAVSVGEISNLVHEAVDQALAARQAAAEVSSGMERIFDFSHENELMIQQIAAAMEQQSATVEEISANIKDLDTISESNASASEEITATVLDLSRIAGDANTQIGRFEVSGRGRHTDFAVMRQAHLQWLWTTHDVLEGRQDAAAVNIVSHRDCKLGKWLYATEMDRFRHLEEIQQLEREHKQMHQCVRSAIEANRLGARIEAREALHCVERLSGRVVNHLFHVESEVMGGRESVS